MVTSDMIQQSDMNAIAFVLMQISRTAFALIYISRTNARGIQISRVA